MEKNKKVKYIGIDTGLNGAFAFFDSDLNLLSISDMPLLNKATVDIWRVYNLLNSVENKNAIIGIEVPTFSTQEATRMSQNAAMKFGINFQTVMSIIQLSNRSYYSVHPKTWKSMYNLIGKTKMESCMKAITFYSEHSELFAKDVPKYRNKLTTKYYDGRAEAVLIMISVIAKYKLEKI